MRFRRLPNLRDILTSSTIPPNHITDTKPSVHIPVCTRLRRCTYCPRIKKVEQITSFHGKQVFKNVASNTLEKPRDPSGTGCRNTKQVFRNSNLKNPLLSLDTSHRKITHKYVCMKICPLMAPITQVPPLPFIFILGTSSQGLTSSMTSQIRRHESNDVNDTMTSNDIIMNHLNYYVTSLVTRLPITSYIRAAFQSLQISVWNHAVVFLIVLKVNIFMIHTRKFIFITIVNQSLTNCY